MLNLYYRLYQMVFKIIVAVIPFHFPKVISKENAIYEIAPLLNDELKISSVLFVTDPQLSKINLTKPLLDDLNAKGIKVALYDQTKANPTVDNIEEALIAYHGNNCQAIIAFGGGSPIDCAKGVAARVARPNKSLRQMKGVLGVLRRTPLVIAIPTTSGTGSETTLACVVTNPHTHEKYAITDPNLFPAYAILDPILTKNLPPHITSTTGMDALTHAIEAYIGQANTKETRALAIEAIQLIFENLVEAYEHPENMNARLNMQKAAFKAGKAFTMAYVGNVHALAHTLGGFYNTPHGLANAILLPRVLRYYESSVTLKLAELSDLTKLTVKSASSIDKAEAFIAQIESMNTRMNIPSDLKGILDSDIPKMAKNAYSEANPFYPVPKIFTHKDFEILLLSIRQTV
jgi:alcohol dehydrogenase class IV